MKKRIWEGVLFGTALAIGTAFAVLPMEALANAWTCNESDCSGDEHDHPVTVGSGQEITEGTFNGTVTVDGGTISGGTFNFMIEVNNGGEISNFTDAGINGFIKVNQGGKITGGIFDKQVEVSGGRSREERLKIMIRKLISEPSQVVLLRNWLITTEL